VQGHGDIAIAGEPEHVIDELGVRTVVLMDLEPAGTGVQQRLERDVVLSSGAGLQPDVDRASR
jgi:hypothetical protein